MSTIERARPIFESVLGPLDGYGPETSPFDVAKWDSIAHVNILLEIETAFGVRFSAEDLGNVQSVGAICDAVDLMRGSAELGAGPTKVSV